MSYRSINEILIANVFNEELEQLCDGDNINAVFSKTINLLQQELPGCNIDEIIKIIRIMSVCAKRDDEDVELVVTAPQSFELKTKRTENVVEDMLQNSNKSILMTGYSVSEYVDRYLDLIVDKSRNGIFVKLFFNDINEQSAINKLISYRGKFLEIYDYSNKQDKMAALHAKILSVDGNKSLISSANMSYHGMSGNIEMGCFVNSAKLAKHLNELFNQLIFQKVFIKHDV